jgi:hypothetical protein
MMSIGMPTALATPRLELTQWPFSCDRGLVGSFGATSTPGQITGPEG